LLSINEINPSWHKIPPFHCSQVIQDLADKADKESVILTTLKHELKLLNTALNYNYADEDAAESRALQQYAMGEVEEDDNITPQVH
jgi:hypothetical protein